MVNNNTKDEKVEKLPKMKMGLLVGVKNTFRLNDLDGMALGGKSCVALTLKSKD